MSSEKIKQTTDSSDDFFESMLGDDVVPLSSKARLDLKPHKNKHQAWQSAESSSAG